jgi:hypothetical protein
MELLFVVLLAAGLSLGVRYIFRDRYTFGSAMFPALGAAVASVVWAGLTWLDWSFGGGWIWVVSLLAGPIVCLAVGLFLPKRRVKADAELLDSLSRA